MRLSEFWCLMEKRSFQTNYVLAPYVFTTLKSRIHSLFPQLLRSKLLNFHKIYPDGQRQWGSYVLDKSIRLGIDRQLPMALKKYPSLFLLVLLFFGRPGGGLPSLLAQLTEVQGTVTDAQSGLPLAFANVFFPNTSVGSLTDNQGYFELITSEKVDTLAISFLGYQTQYVRIKPGEKQQIDIALQGETYSLSEVVIVPPAYPIIRKAIQRKIQNDRKNHPYLQYEAYTKIELGLNNLSEKVRKKAIYKPFRKILNSPIQPDRNPIFRYS